MPQSQLLVISIHGASWEGLAPWIEQGNMPTLNAIKESGSFGDLHAFLPNFSSNNWASFWTGQSPGHHSIFASIGLSPTGVNTRFANRLFLSRPSWLDLASQNGLRCASLYAPLTYPPQPVNGCILSRHEGKIFTTPNALAQELHDTFPSLLIPKYLQFMPPDGFKNAQDVHEFVEKQIQSVNQTRDIADHLFKKSPWDLAVVEFFAPDSVHHVLWHGMDKEHPEFDPSIREELQAFFSAMDAAVRDVIQICQPSAVLLFTTHGYTTCKKIVNLSRAVREYVVPELLPLPKSILKGLSRFADGKIVFSRPQLKQLTSLDPLPWRPSTILLDDKAIYIHKSGLFPDRVTDILIRSLERFMDPDTNLPVIRKVWRAEDLFGQVDLSGWHILIMEPEEGYTTRSGTVQRPLFWPQKPGQDSLISTHTQKGLWAFKTQNGTQRRVSAGIVDLPATILDYLGLAIPEWMEGKALTK